jgi:hypothetical protein
MDSVLAASVRRELQTSSTVLAGVCCFIVSLCPLSSILIQYVQALYSHLMHLHPPGEHYAQGYQCKIPGGSDFITMGM